MIQDFTGPVVEDREILAWRSWRFELDEISAFERAVLTHSEYHRLPAVRRRVVGLHSVYSACAWTGPTFRADYLPEANNGCGVYALKQRPALSEGRVGEFNYAGYVRMPVSGIVALSGRVVEGALGYRAEVATIRELRLGYPIWQDYADADELIELLGERYQCPVAVEDDDWSAWAPRSQWDPELSARKSEMRSEAVSQYYQHYLHAAAIRLVPPDPAPIQLTPWTPIIQLDIE